MARPQRGLALGAALTLVGTAAGRKFGGPTDSGTHLYILGLARTAGGKDHAIRCIPRILDASTMGAHDGPPQFMSMSAVVNCLKTQPLSLCAMDEFGSFLKRVNNKKAAGHEQAISGTLREAWGVSFGSMKTAAYADRQSEKILAPAMSIYGASTPQEFYQAIEGGDVFNGFLNRFMIITTNVRPTEVEPELSKFEVPSAITDRMIGIYTAGGDLLGATSHSKTADRPPITVPWDEPQAKHVYRTLGRLIENREQDSAFLARTQEMALRLATIRAIGANHIHPRVSVADMEWGRDLALWCANRMIADASDYMSENDRQADAQRVVRIVKDRKRVKAGDIGRAMQHKLRSNDLKDILAGLVDSGQLVVETIRPEAGGKMVDWYTPG